MSRREMLIVARMEERLAAVCEAVPPIRPPAAYWLDSDAGPSYCYRCAIKARGAEFELGAPLVISPSYDRDDLEDAFYDGIDGGFDTESDSSVQCDTCGRMLSYILSAYGVEQEVDYYREAPLCAVRYEDTYALDRLALNIWHGAARSQIVGVLMAINQAWRLLKEPRP